MARFIERFGQEMQKAKRLGELKGLLEGWKLRAEGAEDFNMSDNEKVALKTAAQAVESAISALVIFK